MFHNHFKRVQNVLIALAVLTSLVAHLMATELFGRLYTKYATPTRRLEVDLSGVTRLSKMRKRGHTPVNAKQWAAFYVTVVLYLAAFAYLTNRFLLIQTFDKDQYVQQKVGAWQPQNCLKHLNEVRLRLNEIKKRS